MAHADIDLTTGRIVVQSDFREKDLIAAVPGSHWDPATRTWNVPLAWTSCKALRGLFGSSLTIGPELNDWATALVNQYVKPLSALRTAEDHSVGDPRLYPFQRADVAWLKLARHGVLGQPMGAGKTISAATALRELGEAALPALVVCPNTVKSTWERELRRWYPECKPVVIRSGAGKAKAFKSIDQHSVVIINYEAVRLHSRMAGFGDIALTDAEKKPKELNAVGFKTLIADEAHRIKSPRAKQTRAIWAAAEGTTYRWAMTGTPLVNTPDDLWSILHFVDPVEWSGKSKWLDRYCLTAWGQWGGMEVVGFRQDTKAEFFATFDHHFRRLPKEVILPQLPPKVIEDRSVPMSPKQRKAYAEMQTRMMTELENGTLITTSPLTKGIRLMQFASAYGQLNESDAGSAVKLTAPSCKIDALMETIEDLDRDEPAVIFAESRDLVFLAQAALTEAGFSTRLIMGGVSEEDRARNIDDFQAGKVRFIICTIRAGGTGITLTRASKAIFLQRTWSKVDNSQAEDRIHRIGSEAHDSVTIINLITENSIEELQMEALEAKGERAEEVLRDRDFWTRALKVMK